MLVSATRLIGAPILSMQAAAQIATVTGFVIDPDSLKIIAFIVRGVVPGSIIVSSSVREYSQYGMVIDSEDEIVEPDDVIKVSKILQLNFSLFGLKVETRKGTKLGKVTDFTVTPDNFSTQQIIVKRPALKSFLDPELIIPRREIVEVNDHKIIVKDEEKTIRERAMGEDFVPNFVNPFRSPQSAHASDNEQPLAT